MQRFIGDSIGCLGLCISMHLLLCVPLFSQTTFQRTFGNSANDNIVNPSDGVHGTVFPTSDGGYAAIGCYGVTGTDPDIMLVKFNSDATTINWSKTYTGGGGDDDFGYSGAQTSDGGYIIAGEYRGFAGNELYVIKTASDGSISWTKQYAGSGAGRPVIGYSVVQTTDDGYLIGGSGRVGGPGTFYDMYMVKLASDGSHQWSKGYSGTNSANDYGYEAIETSDGGYLLAGKVFNGSNYDVFLVKTNSSGVISWADQITLGASNDLAYSVAQTTDGGYVMTGSGTNNDLLIMKVDNSGNFSWAKTYDPSSTNSDGRCIRETSDGGYIVAGSRSTSSNSDIILLKTTSDGTLQWCKYFAGTADGSNEFGSSVSICSDGGYILSGYVADQSTASQVLYVVKTASDGTLADASCPSTSSVVPTVTARTATVVNTPTTTVTYSLVSTGGSSTTVTVTAKNFCTNSTTLTLPVEMIHFSSACDDGDVTLNWRTASEVNNSHFIVERSLGTSDLEWTELGMVKGSGTISHEVSYQFTDTQGSEFSSEIFYRVKQVDYNGRYEYFGPVRSGCAHEKGISIHIIENPVSGVMQAQVFSDQDGNAQVALYNMLGQIIHEGEMNLKQGSNLLRMSLDAYESGIYFLEVKMGEERNIQKILIR